MKPKSTSHRFLILAGSSLLAISFASAQIDGDWNLNNNGNWSSSGNWLGTPDPVPGGAGSIINFTNDITANRTVTIDTTSRTVGTLNIGDSNNSHGFTLAASGGASLIFDNNGSGASIIETGSIRDFISAPITLADNLATNIGGSLQLSGDISESGGARSITKSGGGSLILTGNNTFSGGVTLNAGQINIGNDGALGTGTFTINGGRVDLAGVGAGGNYTTTNNNAWNANWTMGRGTTGTGTWNNNGDVLLGANVTVSSANNFTALNLGGAISDGGNGYSLAINTSSVTLSGANTYSGGTSFTGILNINHAQALGTGALTITGGTRTIDNTSGNAITLSNSNAVNLANTLVFTGTNELNMGNGAVTLQGDNRTVTVTAGTLTFGGAVGQDVAGRQLIVQGNGTLVLNGDNTYTGATQVNQNSTLLINGNASSATGAMTVATAATLGGSGIVGGNTTVNGFLAPGNSAGVLEFVGSLTLAGTSTTTMEIFGSDRGPAINGYDGIDVGTTLAYGGALVINLQTLFSEGAYTFNLFDQFTSNSGSFSSVSLIGDYTGSLIDDGFGLWGLSNGTENWTFTQSTGNLSLVVIPEPTTALLGALGLLALLRRRR